MKIFVYIVDDNLLLARSFENGLKSRGIAVKTETNPYKALEYLCSNVDIDVSFIDLVMPLLDGSQLYKYILEKAPARKARIVFLTGYAEMGADWLKKSGQQVLEKPVSIDHLMKVAYDFAKLDAPKGPRGKESSSYVVPDKSHPELPALYDEKEEVTTGILELAEKIPGISKEALQELQIRYLIKKMKEHDEVVENMKFLTKYAKWSWAIAIGLGALFMGIQKLLEHVVFK